MKRYTDYDTFAWLYNREWGAYPNNIFPALKIIAGDKLKDGAKILDVCCGTGQLAKVLTDKGYTVTGIDGSAKMLRYARQNAPGARFITADARIFELSPEYDAVFSTFDALNHIMTIDALAQCFSSVFACLVSGGVFIFDLNLKGHFDTHMKIFSKAVEKPEYLFTIQTDYAEETRIGKWHLTLFRPEGPLWKRTDMFLQQTWYPIESVKAALQKAGFGNIRVLGFNTQREMIDVTDDSSRGFFYAEKP